MSGILSSCIVLIYTDVGAAQSGLSLVENCSWDISCSRIGRFPVLGFIPICWVPFEALGIKVQESVPKVIMGLVRHAYLVLVFGRVGRALAQYSSCILYEFFVLLKSVGWLQGMCWRPQLTL